MDKNITRISNLLKELYGIDISKYNNSFLSKSVERRVKEVQCSSLEVYFRYLEQNEEEAQLFSNSLHNSYSKFFRNSFTFSVLEQLVLPKLIHNKKGDKRKEIRIWSSACASGQEVYSLAILLEELKNGDNEKFTYRIFATDQCKSQITKATKGKYTAQDLSNMSLKRTNQWFTKRGDTYAVKKILKKKISFSVFDLFNEQLMSPPTSVFGEFDLIICANVLIYYKKEYQNKILNKASKNLINEGYIVSGGSERSILIAKNYKEVYPQSAIFHRES